MSMPILLCLIFTVVTGGSEGIGKAYAQELARRGLNVVIISKNENRLHRTVKEIGIFLLKCSLWNQMNKTTMKNVIYDK